MTQLPNAALVSLVSLVSHFRTRAPYTLREDGTRKCLTSLTRLTKEAPPGHAQHQQPAHGTRALGVAGPAASVLRGVLVAAERASGSGSTTPPQACRVYSVWNEFGLRSDRIKTGATSRGSRPTGRGGICDEFS